MTNMSIEIEGSIDEVVSVLRQLGTAGSPATAGDSDRSIEEHAADVRESAPAAQAQVMAVAEEAPLRAWTETLARDFLAELEPMARRVGAARLAGRRGGHSSERPVPAYGTDTHGVGLAGDADGSRAAEVPAGAWDDPVPASGGQQPATELFHRY